MPGSIPSRYLFLAACLVTMSSLSKGAAPYAKEEFGFVVELPGGWGVHAERDQGDQFIVAFGLPAIANSR